MRIYTSYFYQIRFFTPDILPLSTALWDPKWYHQGKGPSHIYKDSRGVYNGLRYQLLMPGHSCNGECTGRITCPYRDPSQCDFLKHYRKQLDAIDFRWLINDLQSLVINTAKVFGLPNNLNVCLIFHEAPTNPCSEREVVKQWFQDHYYPISEWSKL